MSVVPVNFTFLKVNVDSLVISKPVLPERLIVEILSPDAAPCTMKIPSAVSPTFWVDI